MNAAKSIVDTPACKTAHRATQALAVAVASTVVALLLATPLSAADSAAPKAHPVSVIEADIFVTKFRTTMRLRCFAEDLDLLQGVEALEDGFYDAEELHDATIDHADYLAEKIQVLQSDGTILKPKIVEIQHFEAPEEGIRQGELMKYTIGIELEYSYEESPEFLTIQQQIVAEGLLLPSELKILLKQEGSDEPYFHMMKPDEPETFRFDWNNPAPNSEAGEEEWSSWFEEQRQQTLGIASYSSVYSFIYITNFQVRHEILVPLATLNTFFEIERAEESFLDIPEQDAIRDKIETFFSAGNPVVIDNIEVQPVFDRIDFYGLELRDFAMQSERRKVSMANGRVGIIMSYSTKGMPQQVELTWDIFNGNLKTVDAVVFAFEDAGTAEFSMFKDDNTYRWTSDDREPPEPITGVGGSTQFRQPKLPVPILSLILAMFAVPVTLAIPFSRKPIVPGILAVLLVGGIWFGRGLCRTQIDHPSRQAVVITESQAASVFGQLHRNLFRAFDYHDESAIYDALAHSVDGELLRQMYLELTETLRVAEQGGAVSRVEEVRFLDGTMSEASGPTELSPDPSFTYRSQWELLGTVEHWGHIHERENRYDASFQVKMIDGDWKITDYQLLDFDQSAGKTRLRKL